MPPRLQDRFDTREELDELPPFRDWLKHCRVDAHEMRRADQLLFAADLRADANETALFARALEYVKAVTYDIKYARMQLRELVPIDTSAPEGAQSITYESWDEVREARIVANAADDLPNVEVFARETTTKVVTIGSAYLWSVLDLMRAAMSGKSIDTRRAQAAMRAIEQKTDDLGAVGDVSIGNTGLLNNPDVTDRAPVNAGAWSGLTSLQILANLHDLAQSIVTLTRGIHRPNTLVLPTAEYGLIASKPLSATGDSSQTVLSAFRQNDPYISRIEQWPKLATAGTGGAPLILCYELSPEVLQFNIPMPVMQLPPQPRNLAFVVPMLSRVGSVEMHYPKAVAYQTID